jgi:hypothetical protein
MVSLDTLLFSSFRIALRLELLHNLFTLKSLTFLKNAGVIADVL